MRFLGLAASLALCSTSFCAETVTRPRVTPVQAELVSDVHAHLLKAGQAVYARVLADWHGTDCFLRSGATIEARVVSVVPHTRTAKGSELSLAFTRAQCGELKMSEFGLMLSALASPPQNYDLGVLTAPTPMGTSSQGASASGQAALQNVKSMQFASSFNQKLNMGSLAPPLPQMQMGEVVGIKHVKLSVGTGPESSSVLTSEDRDLSLETHTVLLLVPAQGTFPRGPADPGSTQPATDASRATAAVRVENAPPPADDVNLCEPPNCSVALPLDNSTDTGDAAATISISQLGYVSRPQRVMSSFDNDEVLAYLAPRQLLVAFNPHILVSRHVFGNSGSTVRVIRAALVDTQTRMVKTSVEWELPDNGRYLWPLGDDRILVHVGSELRVYGEGLKIQKRVALGGSLAFVRVTPDGSFIAVGVIRERHSPELHAEMTQSLEGAPEEDVDILVLNRNFESIAASTARSSLMAPTLLNEGQAKLLAQPNMRYRIAFQSWDNRSSTVARFNSSCTPEISSIAPNLIFLLSCDKQTEEPEYRVLRTNGKLALKGVPSQSECGYAAAGSANREAFVVKTVRASRPVPMGASFSEGDLSGEELRVYRAADGKRLLRVLAGAPSSSRDGFALAPDGSQLAVLTRDGIAVYRVAVK